MAVFWKQYRIYATISRLVKKELPTSLVSLVQTGFPSDLFTKKRKLSYRYFDTLIELNSMIAESACMFLLLSMYLLLMPSYFQRNMYIYIYFVGLAPNYQDLKFRILANVVLCYIIG